VGREGEKREKKRERKGRRKVERKGGKGEGHLIFLHGLMPLVQQHGYLWNCTVVT